MRDKIGFSLSGALHLKSEKVEKKLEKEVFKKEVNFVP